jgi:hypothetical protein
MPESSADYRVWTVRLRPGTLFSPNPAFGGRPRELVAADYVYSFMRLADPANKSTAWSALEQSGISGLAARRREDAAKAEMRAKAKEDMARANAEMLVAGGMCTGYCVQLYRRNDLISLYRYIMISPCLALIGQIIFLIFEMDKA